MACHCKINFTIRERFQKLIMNAGRASSIFNVQNCRYIVNDISNCKHLSFNCLPFIPVRPVANRLSVYTIVCHLFRMKRKNILLGMFYK